MESRSQPYMTVWSTLFKSTSIVTLTEASLTAQSDILLSFCLLPHNPRTQACMIKTSLFCRLSGPIYHAYQYYKNQRTWEASRLIHIHGVFAHDGTCHCHHEEVKLLTAPNGDSFLHVAHAICASSLLPSLKSFNRYRKRPYRPYWQCCNPRNQQDAHDNPQEAPRSPIPNTMSVNKCLDNKSSHRFCCRGGADL